MSEKLDHISRPSKVWVFFALGLGLNLMWCTLMGHTSGFLLSSMAFSVWINPRTLFLIGIFTTSCIAIVFPGLLRFQDRPLKYCVPLISAMGTACFAVSYHQELFNPFVLATMGLIVSGVGYSWIVARLNLLMVRTQGVSCVVWSTIGALIIMQVASIVFHSIPNSSWQVLIAILLPICAAVVFEVARNTIYRQSTVAGETESASRTVFGIPIESRLPSIPKENRTSLYICLTIGSLLLAVVRALGSLGVWADTNVILSQTEYLVVGTLIATVLLLLFGYFTLIRTITYSVEIRFIPAIIAILACLFLSAIDIPLPIPFSVLISEIIQIADLCAHVLFWTMIASAVEGLNVPSYRVMGIAGSAYSIFSALWVFLMHSTTIVDSAFISLTAYGLFILVTFSLWVGFRKLRQPQTILQQAPPLSTTVVLEEPTKEEEPSEVMATRCAQIAEEYKLSPRETEIFLLLAQGRTREFIKDELVLSGNTVKTHVSHIYTKIGVHDRQEMIDLVWKK